MRPFVTCLCVTRNRPKWLNLAMEYFRARTFNDAELLIVADGEIVHDPCEPHIRVVNLTSRPATLGEKRNIGCALAGGDVISLWDDDDYHAPTRLEDQLTTLSRSGLSVTAYNRMKFTDGSNWWMYDGIIQCVGIGGSLCFTKDYWKRNMFDPQSGIKKEHGFVTEDGYFVYDAFRRQNFIATQACRQDPVAGLEDGDKMYATIHPGNTSPRNDAKIGRDYTNYAYLGKSNAPKRVLDAFLAAEAQNLCR